MKKVLQRIVISVLTVAILAGSMQALMAFSASAPAVPSNVKANSASYNSIKISWSPVKSASGYEVYRYNSSKKSYERLTATKSTGFTNTGLTTGNTYSYKVKAYQTVNRKTVYGSFSSAVSAKPIPSVPANFKAAAQYESIKLTWSAVSGATGYVIDRYNAAKKTFERIKTTSSTSFTNSGLITGTNYSYRIKAYRTVNKIGVYGNPTVAMNAKPRPFQLEDLNGKRVAVQNCTTSDFFASELLEKGKIHFTILRYDMLSQCFDSMKKGKADAVLSDDILTSYYSKMKGKIVWRSGEGEPMGICLKKGNNDLKALTEGAMDTLYYNGTMTKIATKYFGSDITKGIRTVTAKPVLNLSKLKTIKAGTLKVGMEIGYPPMEYLADDGVSYIGFDVEVAQKIAELFGLKLEIVNTAWDGIFAALDKGEFDIIISAVTITPDRQTAFNMTKPYILDRQAIILPG